ncbi:F-box/FBD/LRR-repeat protein At1g16930-like [Silene latifolia]|uniref:F-box/FBD/LRR-repeat protein At1g16930-like n=1 Tax=Silene latifolia TaxID=37657 RepID=UPI003D77136D
MGFEENVAKMKRGTIDRISEVPDFIVHTTLSMLDTKEAGRASVLSKRWYGAWSSIPVLDFRPQFFREFQYSTSVYDDDSVQRFVRFVDKTMQRYFSQKYRIREMYLMVSMNDKKLESFIDKWIMIAVQNQIQKLEIEVDSEIIYRLPEILFCAKSLKYLECVQIELPYYETMELVSLEYLTLESTDVDDNMLQRIISFCPLVELDITCSKHLDSISLPWMRKVDGIEGCGSGTTESYLASPLQEFVFTGSSFDLSWPWKMNVVALKNLRKLEICSVSITDDIVSELASGPNCLTVLRSSVTMDEINEDYVCIIIDYGRRGGPTEQCCYLVTIQTQRVKAA